MRFDFFSLKLFVDVVDASTIAAAAQRNHIALSAASRRMVELEKSFGTRLLERKPHGVQATEAGRFLYQRVSHTLADMRKLSVEMSRFSQGAQGSVRLAVDAAALAGTLPQRLSSFCAQHPHIDVELAERPSEEGLRAVSRGEADVCIAGWLAERDPDLVYWRYAATELVAVIPFGHRLGRQGPGLTLADLLAEDIVAVESSGVERWLALAAASHGSSRASRIKVASYASACRMVSARCGVAVMPREYADPYAAPLGLRLAHLDAAIARAELELCSRALDATPVAARCLIDHLRCMQGNGKAAARSAPMQSVGAVAQA